MSKLLMISEIIRSASMIYIFTTDQPTEKSSLLPFHIFQDGKLYLCIPSHKPIYEQMRLHPQVEILTSKEGKLMHYTGTACFEEDDTIARQVLANTPSLRAMYNESTGQTIAVFHLENASVCINDIMNQEETIQFDL